MCEVLGGVIDTLSGGRAPADITDPYGNAGKAEYPNQAILFLVTSRTAAPTVSIPPRM